MIQVRNRISCTEVKGWRRGGRNERIQMANQAGTCSSPAMGTEGWRSDRDGLSGLGNCKDGPENPGPTEIKIWVEGQA